MFRLRLPTVVLLLAVLFQGAGPVFAQDPGEGIEWNGFLNVVGGRDLHASDSDRPSFYGDDVLFDEDTSAGLQAKKTLDGQTSVTAQLLAKGADGYEARLRWLYLSHELTGDDLLRLA